MTSLKLVFAVAVAAVLGHGTALSDEERNTIKAGLIPVVMECSKQYGVSEDELKQAKESGNIGSINPCLMGCVFKKINVINDEGLFDTEKSGEMAKKFLSGGDQSKADEIIKTCSSVNDQEVSDGAEGCERSKLLFDCLLPFKADFLKAR